MIGVQSNDSSFRCIYPRPITPTGPVYHTENGAVMTSQKSFTVDDTNAVDLKLVAVNSARDDHAHPGREITESKPATRHSYFKSAQWSADGTCIIANSADNHIRTFVIPPELLEKRAEPLKLNSYAEVASHESVDAISLYPRFNLQDASTTLVLSAINEHPIRLNSALTTDLVASYPLKHPTTESLVKPNSLAFSHDGSHFVAGSESLISIFDLAKPGREPVTTVRTGPKNNKSAWEDPEMAMRGIVSALAVDPQHHVLAAGSFTRHVGLYDSVGFGMCVGVFSLHGTEADQRIGGQGITQVLWSPCGRYLYIVERKSDGLVMYDIRQTGQMLGWFEGRHANTNQRLFVDLSRTEAGDQHELWCGGTDGVVRAWKNPHHAEGAIGCSSQYPLHNNAVGSCVVHPSGGLLATVSGQRELLDPFDAERRLSSHAKDVSLKLWLL